DAQPILIGPEGIQEGPEKIKSPMRAKFRAVADRRGYPVALAEAMVDPDIEVFEASIDGEREFVTLDGIEAAKDRGRKVEVGAVVVKEGHLLTLTGPQTVEYGFGKEASSRADVYRDLGVRVSGEQQFAFSWSETFVGFLTSPIVSLLLMIVGILGVWIELKTPGFGVPGIAGLLAFAVLLFGHHLAGLAEVSEILLFAAGVVLVAVEIFVLPGTGIFAILGVFCIFSGLILSFQPFIIPDGDAPWEGDLFLWSIGRVIIGFLISTGFFLLLIRFLKHVPIVGRHVLEADLAAADGAVVPSQQVSDMLVGKTGVAVTTLRPGGKVEIGKAVYDVVTQGDFVSKDDYVTVIGIEGTRIIVERAKRK
ncbi:MAG: NfeD family protein, partial [Planctomycetota bacterium]